MRYNFYFLTLSLAIIGQNSWGWILNSKIGDDIKIMSPDAKPVMAQIGIKLETGTRVKTGPGVKLKFIENKSVLVVGENSEMILEKKKAGEFVHLNFGRLRVEVDKAEAKKYQYSIPSAVVGVRGTEIFLLASDKKEVMCVLEGKVEATIHSTQAQTQISGGQGWIREDDPKGKVVNLTTEDLTKWKSSTAF